MQIRHRTTSLHLLLILGLALVQGQGQPLLGATASAGNDSSAIQAVVRMQELLSLDHEDLAALKKAVDSRASNPDMALQQRYQSGLSTFVVRRTRLLNLVSQLQNRLPDQTGALGKIEQEVSTWSDGLGVPVRRRKIMTSKAGSVDGSAIAAASPSPGTPPVARDTDKLSDSRNGTQTVARRQSRKNLAAARERRRIARAAAQASPTQIANRAPSSQARWTPAPQSQPAPAVRQTGTELSRSGQQLMSAQTSRGRLEPAERSRTAARSNLARLAAQLASRKRQSEQSAPNLPPGARLSRTTGLSHSSRRSAQPRIPPMPARPILNAPEVPPRQNVSVARRSYRASPGPMAKPHENRLAQIMRNYRVSDGTAAVGQPLPPRTTRRPVASPTASRGRPASRNIWHENQQIQNRLRQIQLAQASSTMSQSQRSPFQGQAVADVPPGLLSEPINQVYSKRKVELKNRLKSLLSDGETSPAPDRSPQRGNSRASVGDEFTPDRERLHKNTPIGVNLTELDSLVTSLGAPPISEPGQREGGPEDPDGPASFDDPEEDEEEAEPEMSGGIAAALAAQQAAEEAAAIRQMRVLESEETASTKATKKTTPGLEGVYEVFQEDEKSVERPDVPDEIGTHNFEGPDGQGESVYQIIRTLAEQMGLNIVIKGSITGKMILNVENASTWDVLESVMNDQGLEYELKQGRLLKIYGSGVPISIQKTYRFASNQNAREYQQLIQTLVFATDQVPQASATSGGQAIGAPAGPAQIQLPQPQQPEGPPGEGEFEEGEERGPPGEGPDEPPMPPPPPE